MIEHFPQILANSLISGSLYALAAAGLALCYGLLGILNLAHGHFMMLAAYIFLLCISSVSGSYAIALPLSLFILLLLSCAVLRIVFIPLRAYGMAVVLIATLAVAIIFESAVSLTFGVTALSLPQRWSIESFEIAGAFITPQQLVIILCSFGVLVTVSLLTHQTGLGRRVRALAENEYAGRALGISQNRIHFIFFVIAILLAGLGGLFIAYETNLQPFMGSAYTIKAFAAMVLGGMGNLWGAIIGAYMLALLENFGVGLEFFGYSLPAGYKDAFAYSIILIVLLLRPQGLAGRRVREG